MSLKIDRLILVAAILAALIGCKDHSGEKFVGHWDSADKNIKAFIDVKEDGDVYHFDHSFLFPGLDKLEYKVERFEGKPVSDSVLRLGVGSPTYDVRLENDTLYFRGHGYVKDR